MKWIGCCLVMAWAGSVGATGMVAQEAVHAAVERFVRAELQESLDGEGRVEIDIRWQNDIPVEREGEVELAVRRLSARPLRGPTVVQLIVRLNGQVWRELNVTADIRWFRPALVAARGLQRGEPLRPGLVEVQEQDITQARDGFFGAPDDLAGLRMRVPLRPGELLTRRHTEAVPVVQRGDPLSMVVETGNLRISTVGTALQDGALGERVRVRNADSGKIVYGEVIAPGKVRLGW